MEPSDPSLTSTKSPRKDTPLNGHVVCLAGFKKKDRQGRVFLTLSVDCEAAC